MLKQTHTFPQAVETHKIAHSKTLCQEFILRVSATISARVTKWMKDRKFMVQFQVKLKVRKHCKNAIAEGFWLITFRTSIFFTSKLCTWLCSDVIGRADVLKCLPYVWVRVVRNQGDMVPISQNDDFLFSICLIALKIVYWFTKSNSHVLSRYSEETVRSMSYWQHQTIHSQNEYFWWPCHGSEWMVCHSIQKKEITALVDHILKYCDSPWGRMSRLNFKHSAFLCRDDL
jgi:hypothetical protein